LRKLAGYDYPVTRRAYHRAYYQRNAERLRERRRVHKLMQSRRDGVMPLSKKERRVKIICEQLVLQWSPPRQVVRQYLIERDAAEHAHAALSRRRRTST
jgi:hypothetical protein